MGQREQQAGTVCSGARGRDVKGLAILADEVRLFEEGQHMLMEVFRELAQHDHKGGAAYRPAGTP